MNQTDLDSDPAVDPQLAAHLRRTLHGIAAAPLAERTRTSLFEATKLRSRATVPASGLFVLGLVATAIVVRHVAATHEEQAKSGQPAGAATDVTKRAVNAADLLFPSRTGSRPPEISSVPGTDQYAIAMIESPDGGLFRISASAAGSNPFLPRDAPTQVINGNSFAGPYVDTSADSWMRNFWTTNGCVGLTISQFGTSLVNHADADAAPRALAAVSTSGTAGFVQLPPGWRSHGGGNPGELLQVAFWPTGSNDDSDAVVLMQMVGSSIAALPSIGDHVLVPTDVGRTRTWLVELTAIERRMLVWSDGGNAVALTGNLSMTTDELIGIAVELERGHAAEWQGALAATAPQATFAPTPTGPRVREPEAGGQGVAGTGSCTGNPMLTISP